MKWSPSPADIRWWFWIVTLLFIVAALAGWTPGYYVVMAISALQVVYFLIQEKSLSSWPVQVRIVYFAWSLFGFVAGRARRALRTAAAGHDHGDVLWPVLHHHAVEAYALEPGATGSPVLGAARAHPPACTASGVVDPG